jgi:hypothetical protein
MVGEERAESNLVSRQRGNLGVLLTHKATKGMIILTWSGENDPLKNGLAISLVHRDITGLQCPKDSKKEEAGAFYFWDKKGVLPSRRVNTYQRDFHQPQVNSKEKQASLYKD